MNNRRISEIQARIENCSNEEINAVVSMIKNRRSELSMNAGSKLHIGQKVQFSGRRGLVKGVISKINMKTAIVSTDTMGQWKVSMTLLEAA